MRDEDNLKEESGFTLKTLILTSSAIAVGVIIIILLVVAICASCSNKTYTPTNTSPAVTYTPPVTTTTQEVEVPVDNSSSDWETLYVSDTNGGLVVLDYRDPDTGVHYLYFWKRSNGEIEIVPRLAGANGNIMQD